MKNNGAVLNNAHYLFGCRFDNWLRLLWQNKFRVRPDRMLQAICITLISLILFPFALLEAAVFALPIRRTRIEKDPVFIIGHWRTGTTFLLNLMSRDTELGWCDPVNTTMFNNSFLLGWLLKYAEKGALKNARPMDNLQYDLDLPMEETFAVADITPYSIIHMIAFPKNYLHYMSSAFVADMPEKHRNNWKRAYMHVIRKITYSYKGKRLLLKSPDNTCRIRALMEMFPDARFVNIYRNPYKTIVSTINMFKKQMELLAITDVPDGDFDITLEDSILYIFERMYRELFALEDEFGQNRFVDIKYEELEKDPLGCMEKIYDSLELEGFDDAFPNFDEYVESMSNYVKNSFNISSRLKGKINDRLGFYFEHYGYEMEVNA